MTVVVSENALPVHRAQSAENEPLVNWVEALGEALGGIARSRTKLSPVLPIVLHNGEQPWTAPLSELIQPLPGPIERFDRADVDTLDRWSRQLLDAERLADVFDDSR